MSDFKPTPVEGAQVCERCKGTGEVPCSDPERDQNGDMIDCPECDGLGEWFE